MMRLDPKFAATYLEDLLSVMAQGVVFIFRDGKIRLVNREAECFLGIQAEDVEGRPYRALFPKGGLGIEVKEYLKKPLPPIKVYPTLQGYELEVEIRSGEVEGEFRGIALLIRDLKEAQLSAETIWHKRGKSTLPLVAKSPSMQEVVAQAKQVAKGDASCLITGESGTGKEVIAHLIHSASPRKDRAFIQTNCAAIPDNLVESEFFGHERGAFTGASQKRLGRFELAHGGTLLLDEITEFPIRLQPKLLRAIQEQTFERVGGVKSIGVDVRLIATSNRPIDQALGTHLRKDLYYRLSVIHLHLSPLRERKEDILSLAEAFLKRACIANGTGQKTLSKKAQETLIHHPFPGNIRELSNMMERVCILQTPEVLEACHFFTNF